MHNVRSIQDIPRVIGDHMYIADIGVYGIFAKFDGGGTYTVSLRRDGFQETQLYLQRSDRYEDYQRWMQGDINTVRVFCEVHQLLFGKRPDGDPGESG